MPPGPDGPDRREAAIYVDHATGFEAADHGFHVQKRSGRTDEEVLHEIGATTQNWLLNLIGET